MGARFMCEALCLVAKGHLRKREADGGAADVVKREERVGGAEAEAAAVDEADAAAGPSRRLLGLQVGSPRGSITVGAYGSGLSERLEPRLRPEGDGRGGLRTLAASVRCERLRTTHHPSPRVLQD